MPNPYTTADCIELTQNADAKFFFDSSLTDDLEINSTEGVRFYAEDSSSPDGHEVSFYADDSAVFGFNVDDGFVVNLSTIKLDQSAKLMGLTVLRIEHEGSAAVNIHVRGTDHLILTYDSGGTAQSPKCEFSNNGSVSLTFDDSGTAVMAGTAELDGAIGNFSEGLRMPCRTGNPSSPQEGEVYYHTTEHRIRVYIDSDWYYTDQLG